MDGFSMATVYNIRCLPLSETANYNEAGDFHTTLFFFFVSPSVKGFSRLITQTILLVQINKKIRFSHNDENEKDENENLKV